VTPVPVGPRALVFDARAFGAQVDKLERRMLQFGAVELRSDGEPGDLPLILLEWSDSALLLAGHPATLDETLSASAGSASVPIRILCYPSHKDVALRGRPAGAPPRDDEVNTGPAMPVVGSGGLSQGRAGSFRASGRALAKRSEVCRRPVARSRRPSARGRPFASRAFHSRGCLLREEVDTGRTLDLLEQRIEMAPPEAPLPADLGPRDGSPSREDV
jgi:hypothetical protein